MSSKKTEMVLRERTMNMFSSSWYEETADKIDNIYSLDKKGYVYFIKSKHTGYCKIGIAKNLTNRLNALRQNNGPIVLLGYSFLDEYKEKEKSLHSLFLSKNIYGEWFSFSQEDISDIISEHNFLNIRLNYNSKIIINEGDYFNPDAVTFENEIDNIVVDFIKNKIELNSRYDTREIYNELGIKEISQKKFTMIVMKYARSMNYKYIPSRTNSSRLFTLKPN